MEGSPAGVYFLRVTLFQVHVGENGSFHFFSPLTLFLWAESDARKCFYALSVVDFTVWAVDSMSRDRDAAAEAVEDHDFNEVLTLFYNDRNRVHDPLRASVVLEAV